MRCEIRYLLVSVLLAALTGCLAFEDDLYFDDHGTCRAPGPTSVAGTAEPPLAGAAMPARAIVQAGGAVPIVQTAEPPR